MYGKLNGIFSYKSKSQKVNMIETYNIDVRIKYIVIKLNLFYLSWFNLVRLGASRDNIKEAANFKI